MFTKYDKDGNQRRTPVYVDCSEDKIIVEQNHKEEVNINNIVKRHGIDLIAKTAALQEKEYMFDDIPGNDFQEAMAIIGKAQKSFDAMPSEVRKTFNNNPAEFLDFVQNPDNKDTLIEMGLAVKPAEVQPVEVVVTNQPETPPG
jgi:phage internal scaffolding protein